MRSKLKDAKDHLRKAVKKKKKVEEEINDVLGETEGERHKETLKETAELLREKIKKKNSKKVEQLTNKFMPNVNSLPIGLERYKDSVVFSEMNVTDPLQLPEEPLVYGELRLDEDEREALRLDPKFSVFDTLDEESFEVETEKAFTKMRWHNFYNEEDKDEEVTITVEEKERLDILDAKTRQVYDSETKTLDLRKLRATDVKLNSQV